MRFRCKQCGVSKIFRFPYVATDFCSDECRVAHDVAEALKNEDMFECEEVLRRLAAAFREMNVSAREMIQVLENAAEIASKPPPPPPPRSSRDRNNDKI